jgi:hypothetical protein
MLQKLDMFPSSGEGNVAPTLLDPIESANSITVQLSDF